MDAGSVQLHGFFWKEPATRTTKRIVERITILSSRQKGRWTIMPEAIPLFLFSSFFFWLKHRRRQDKNAKLFFVCSGTPAAAACVQPAPIEQQQQAKKVQHWRDTTPKRTPLFFFPTLCCSTCERTFVRDGRSQSTFLCVSASQKQEKTCRCRGTTGQKGNQKTRWVVAIATGIPATTRSTHLASLPGATHAVNNKNDEPDEVPLVRSVSLGKRVLLLLKIWFSNPVTTPKKPLTKRSSSSRNKRKETCNIANGRIRFAKRENLMYRF